MQPLDLSFNKPVKEYLRNKFQQWYAQEISLQRTGAKAVDLHPSVMKPLGVQWMVDLFNHFQTTPDIICNGFKAAGIIVDCLKWP